MGLIPQLLTAKVMHKRLFPRVNAFTYGIYYYALPLSALDVLPVPRNRFGLASFYDRDHGARDGGSLESWARSLLGHYGVMAADGEIVLIAMPRILGYVFNPVSFWLCHDRAGGLRAVICEVNNTFGETHSYICAHDDGRIIGHEDWLAAVKLFHVSPFLEREGSYRFRFDSRADAFAVWIDFYDADGNKKLLTALTGKLSPLTPESARNAFWRHPLVTFKAIALIHWQAVKLLAKGIRHIRKPVQLQDKTSRTGNLTKM